MCLWKDGDKKVVSGFILLIGDMFQRVSGSIGAIRLRYVLHLP